MISLCCETTIGYAGFKMSQVLFGPNWAGGMFTALGLAGLLVSLLGFLRLVTRPSKDTGREDDREIQNDKSAVVDGFWDRSST